MLFDQFVFFIKYTYGYLFLNNPEVFFCHQLDRQHYPDDEIQRFITESTWLKSQRHGAVRFGVKPLARIDPIADDIPPKPIKGDRNVP